MPEPIEDDLECEIASDVDVTDEVLEGECLEQDIPLNWLNIIRFHKDVIEKAEENVFALPIWIHNDERWTCIDGNHIHSLTENWMIPANAIRSKEFLNSLAGHHAQSMYIGGACYSVDRNDGETWIPDKWVPIIYKEVEIQINGENILVTPKETGWNVTPQVVRSCSKKNENAQELLHKAISNLNDAIQNVGERKPLAEGVKQILFEELGDVFPIGETLETDYIPKNHIAPTSWILFSPPANAGGMSHWLMSDYKKLEEELTEGRSPGGMRLLAGNHPPPAKADAETFFSPIPLTKSQRQAAASIVFTNNPLTVISGPPGTGKSQVVAAVLADCWKNGKSILFTSTNNKAVNVVKERIDDLFNFPMVIRSGNPNANAGGVDTVEKLAAMSTELAILQDAAEIDVQTIEAQFKSLQQQRSEVLNIIESELPERIREKRQDARESFMQCQQIMTELNIKTNEFKQQLAPFEPFSMTIKSFQICLEVHRRWVNKYLSTCVPECLLATRHRMEIQSSIDAYFKQLADMASYFGYLSELKNAEPIVQSDIADLLFAWKTKVVEHLKNFQDLTDSKPEWHAEYDAFKDAAEATSEFERLDTLAANIGRNQDAQQVDIAKSNTVNQQWTQSQKNLEKHGVPQRDFNRKCFVSWKAKYDRIRNKPITFTDRLSLWLPIFQSSNMKLINAFLVEESEMLQDLPDLPEALWPPVMRKFEDIAFRDSLLPVVKAVLEFESCKAARKDLENIRARIRRRHRKICVTAELIDMNASEYRDKEANCDLYNKWIIAAKEKAVISQRAEVAWDNRTKTDRMFGKLQVDISEWMHLKEFNPLFNNDTMHIFQAVVMLKRFLAEDEPQRFNILQQLTAIFLDVEAWNSIRIKLNQIQGIHNSIRDQKDTLAKIEPEKNIVKRWFCSLPKTALKIWPKLDFTQAIEPASMHNKIKSLQLALGEFSSFVNGEYKTNKERADQLKASSIKSLDSLVEKVSDPVLKEELESAIHDDLDRKSDPDERLDDLLSNLDPLLSNLDPQILGTQLRDLDRQIMEQWLELAKRDWAQRSNEQNTGSYVTALQHSYAGSHNGVLPDASYNAFAHALPTATAWVSTAQSSMSIPMRPELFDIVMIDEASQCSVTNILPFAYRAKRLVVIGDEKQLRAIPSVTSRQEEDIARNHELSDFEASRFAHTGNNEWNVYAAAVGALPNGGAGVHMLLDHFRCHPSIISFSNRYIYRQALTLRKYPSDATLPCSVGVNVVNVPQSNSIRGARNISWINEIEAVAVRDLVRQLLINGATNSIGVITAFAGQKKRIITLLETEINEHNILVDTAHGFQGDERDIIIYSPAVSRNVPDGTIRWVGEEPNLINVAVTRAREAFYFVGDIDFCSSMPDASYLGKLARYCQQIQTMRDGGSPAEVELYGWMMMREWGHEVQVHKRIHDLDQELDFYIIKNGRQVAIEVDGKACHRGREGTDTARDTVLRAKNIRSLRFTPLQIQKMPFNLIDCIELALNE